MTMFSSALESTDFPLYLKKDDMIKRSSLYSIGSCDEMFSECATSAGDTYCPSGSSSLAGDDISDHGDAVDLDRIFCFDEEAGSHESRTIQVAPEEVECSSHETPGAGSLRDIFFVEA